MKATRILSILLVMIMLFALPGCEESVDDDSNGNSGIGPEGEDVYVFVWVEVDSLEVADTPTTQSMVALTNIEVALVSYPPVDLISLTVDGATIPEADMEGEEEAYYGNITFRELTGIADLPTSYELSVEFTGGGVSGTVHQVVPGVITVSTVVPDPDGNSDGYVDPEQDITLSITGGDFVYAVIYYDYLMSSTLTRSDSQDHLMEGGQILIPAGSIAEGYMFHVSGAFFNNPISEPGASPNMVGDGHGYLTVESAGFYRSYRTDTVPEPSSSFRGSQNNGRERSIETLKRERRIGVIERITGSH
jgi:hypothetical protein